MEKIAIYQLLVRLFGNKQQQTIYSGTIEENGVGKMNDISDKALTEIKDMGFTHIWLTGVIEHASTTSYPGIDAAPPEIVKGRAGSPYAICDYYDIDPDIAVSVPDRMQEFEQLVDRIHQAGMKVIIDFVPNHVARIYHSGQSSGKAELGDCDDKEKSFAPNNNFYYIPGQKLQLPPHLHPFGKERPFNTSVTYIEEPAKATGNNIFSAQPSDNDWYETVKLNYGIDFMDGEKEYFFPIPDTWKKMTDIVAFWCEKGIDGFRCDMAEMVPVDFWHYAITIIKKKHSDVLFIAEIYKEAKYLEYIHKGKFDFLYDKVGLYDTLRGIVEGRNSVCALSHCWQCLHGLDAYMLRFLENHDEQRIASRFFAKDPWKAIPAMLITATMHKGPVMLYFGQEVGEPAIGAMGFSEDDGRTSIFDYTHVPEHQKWMNNGAFDGALLSDKQKALRKMYKEILHLCKYEAVAIGHFYDLMWANKNTGKVYCYLRYTESQKLLFVANFEEKESRTTVVVPKHALECMNEEAVQKNFSFKSIFGTAVVEEFTIAETELITTGVPLFLAPLQSIVFLLV